MNPMVFLNQFFQMAALNEFAKMLDEKHGDQGGCFCIVPDEGVQAFKKAKADGENPKYICSQEWGHFVTHTWDDEDPLRMVCWAEMGPDRYNEVACAWWKAQGADPDSIVSGVTDLHRKSPDGE
jgi:hypothetical protein